MKGNKSNLSLNVMIIIILLTFILEALHSLKSIDLVLVGVNGICFYFLFINLKEFVNNLYVKNVFTYFLKFYYVSFLLKTYLVNMLISSNNLNINKNFFNYYVIKWLKFSYNNILKEMFKVYYILNLFSSDVNINFLKFSVLNSNFVVRNKIKQVFNSFLFII